MSGHSKWANIKRKKEGNDAAKAKVFTKIGREIMVCVKEGGPDPANNARLRDLIQKAKSNNVPNDNIDRMIKKAAGEGDKNNYENLTYEGYGPNGVAVIVECLTDNKNRTAGDVRHYFDKFGGNLGTTGCVSFMFNQKGVIVIDAEEVDEEKLMDDVFEAGATDFDIDDDVAEITTEPTDVFKAAEALKLMGYNVISAEAAQVPTTYTQLTDEESIKKMNLLLNALEENDDVQQVYHNWEMTEE
ncbi:MAG: YebC/PmpR family DNA-binding transcriptional regulator [Ruminococcus sp.]|nr:YebC/PmpR family DNA-binding transcriptional regulator [Ruminococcus sp.]